MAGNGRQPPRGWHSRGYLPHCDEPGLVQSITFRLADAWPLTALGARASSPAREDEGVAPPVVGARASSPARDDEGFRRMDALLDRGSGDCLLAEPSVAVVVENALLFHDTVRYRLIAWVVMPNHVHVVVEPVPNCSLSTIVQAWKSYSAHAINRSLGRDGRLWQADYFDRYLRDAEHLAATVRYVEWNPVSAGLVARPEQWPFGSARRRSAD